MITGEFKGIQPYVSAVVGIPRLEVFGTVAFLVDTGASVRCLHPRDSIALRLPFDRLVESAMHLRALYAVAC